MKVTLTVKTKDEIKNGKRVIEYADKSLNLTYRLIVKCVGKNTFRTGGKRGYSFIHRADKRFIKRDSLSRTAYYINV